MKKIYISFIALTGMFAVGNVVAQVNQRQYTFGTEANVDKIEKQDEVGSNKALGVTVWSDDFSVPADWEIGPANTQGQWQIVTTTPSQLNTYMGAMNSTTKANGFGAFNAVQYLINGSVDPQDATLKYMDTLDLTAYPAVKVNFEQRYRAFNSDETWVEFSTDAGATWNGVQFNTNVITNDPAAQSLESYNVSSLIGGQDSVMIRFRWLSPSGDDQFGSGYGWMVDDISLETLPDNDIAITSSYWGSVGLNYYQIPKTQVAPIDFSTNVKNEGIATQTDVVLNVDINTGAFTGTSALGVDVAAGQTDSLFLTTPFTPAASVATYNVTWGVTQNETDDVPANNANGNITFNVTDYIYARDKDVAASTSDNAAYGFEVGNLFDIYTDQEVHSVLVKLNSATDNGSTIYARIYSIDAGTGDFVEEGYSDYHQIQSGETSSFLNLPLIFPVPLTTGNTYLAVVATDGAGGTGDDIVVSTSGTSEPQTSFFYNADNPNSTAATWFYTTGTPMVRMNFEDQTSLIENESSFGVALTPNPVSDKIKVSYDVLNATDVKIVVLDMTGKEMATISNENQTAGIYSSTIETAGFASGVYYVTVSTANGSVTKKFVKK